VGTKSEASHAANNVARKINGFTHKLQATGFFKSASTCCQFVRIEQRACSMSMYYDDSLLGFVYQGRALKDDSKRVR